MCRENQWHQTSVVSSTEPSRYGEVVERSTIVRLEQFLRRWPRRQSWHLLQISMSVFENASIIDLNFISRVHRRIWIDGSVCCCSVKQRQSPSHQTPQHHGSAVPIAVEDEASTQQQTVPLTACPSASSSHSETLRRQLHQHRLKQNSNGINISLHHRFLRSLLPPFNSERRTHHQKSHVGLLSLFMYTRIESCHLLFHESQSPCLCPLHAPMPQKTNQTKIPRWRRIDFWTIKKG